MAKEKEEEQKKKERKKERSELVNDDEKISPFTNELIKATRYSSLYRLFFLCVYSSTLGIVCLNTGDDFVIGLDYLFTLM